MPLREEVMQEQMSSLREGMMRLQEKRVLFMKGQLDVHLHKPYPLCSDDISWRIAPNATTS